MGTAQCLPAAPQAATGRHAGCRCAARRHNTWETRTGVFRNGATVRNKALESCALEPTAVKGKAQHSWVSPALCHKQTRQVPALSVDFGIALLPRSLSQGHSPVTSGTCRCGTGLLCHTELVPSLGTRGVREGWRGWQHQELSRALESCSSASSIRQRCLDTTRINKATFAINDELLLLSLTCCCLPGLICSLFAHKHAAGGRQATIKA